MSLERDFEGLARQLGQWDRRRRWAEGFLWLPRGLMAGLLTAAMIAAAARFRPILSNDELVIVAVSLGLGGLLASLFLVLFRRRSLTEQAHFADQQFELKERTVTAVEIRSGRTVTIPALAAEQLKDTLVAVANVDTQNELPLRPDRQQLVLLLVTVLLLAAAMLVPNVQSVILAQQRAVDQVIEEQIQALESIEGEIGQNEELNNGLSQSLLEPIQGAREELQAGDLSREEAVAVLSEAEADLRDLRDRLSTESLQEALVAAGQPLSEDPSSRSLGQALQSGELATASSAANQLADNLANMNSADLEALAEDLAEAAQSLEELDSELAAELDQVAQALASGETESAQQALREAAATLQQRAQEQAAAEQAAAAADQLVQGRQELAQAGRPGSQGEQARQGQASAQGQSDAGPGQGGGQGQGLAQGVQSDEGEGIGGPGPGGGHAENVYVPEAVDLSGDAGVDVQLPAECLGSPDECGALISESSTEFDEEQSLIPYEQVFGDYRNAAYQALDDQYIPLGLKAYVRDYFSSLEP